MVEECQGGREGIEVFGENGSADFDDCELLRRDGGEVRKILLHFSLGPDVAEQLNYSAPGRERSILPGGGSI